MTDDLPDTLLEAARYFDDLDICEAYMRKIKWPDGKITCPACGSDRIGEIKTRRLLRCLDCRKQIRPQVGTVFEGARRLDVWLLVAWCMGAGVPATDMAICRAMDVQPRIVRQARRKIAANSPA